MGLPGTSEKDRIKVALLWLKHGGNVTSVNDIALRIDKNRFEVILIYLSGYGSPDAGPGHPDNMFFLSNIKRLNAFRFSILFKLVKVLKQHRIDILHCHGHKATVYGTIAGRLARTHRVLVHVHGLGRTYNFIRKLTNLFLFPFIHRIIPVADAVEKDVRKTNWFTTNKKMSVLENSVWYERFANVLISKEEAKQMLSLPADSFVFGTVGRMAPTKGLSYLIKAFALACKNVQNIRLIIVGEGRLKETLEQQAQQAGCSQSIHFPGYRDDIEKVYKAMDVFVLPSVAEGMPRAILEAMSAGVPCIATRVGGIPQILEDGKIGRLVEPADENALAQAMVELACQQPEVLSQTARKASQTVKEKYDHEVITKKLENIYQEECNGV